MYRFLVQGLSIDWTDQSHSPFIWQEELSWVEFKYINLLLSSSNGLQQFATLLITRILGAIGLWWTSRIDVDHPLSYWVSFVVHAFLDFYIYSLKCSDSFCLLQQPRSFSVLQLCINSILNRQRADKVYYCILVLKVAEKDQSIIKEQEQEVIMRFVKTRIGSGPTRFLHVTGAGSSLGTSEETIRNAFGQFGVVDVVRVDDKRFCFIIYQGKNLSLSFFILFLLFFSFYSVVGLS